jgi:hypothetical protein
MNKMTLMLSRTYTALLTRSNKWERGSAEGQAVLCALRDYIAMDLGLSQQQVQDDHENLSGSFHLDQSQDLNVPQLTSILSSMGMKVISTFDSLQDAIDAGIMPPEYDRLEKLPPVGEPSPYLVHCLRGCGRSSFLVEEEYRRQMLRPDSTWQCPNCGNYGASWDDLNHEKWCEAEEDEEARLEQEREERAHLPMPNWVYQQGD